MGVAFTGVLHVGIFGLKACKGGRNGLALNEKAHSLQTVRGMVMSNDSKYCSRYLDDAPGIRGDCASHLASGRVCADCPHRNIRAEVRDLRARVAHETLPPHITVMDDGRAMGGSDVCHTCAAHCTVIEDMQLAVSYAEDLLESAQPADHLEAAMDEDWYAQRSDWLSRHGTTTAPRANSKKAGESQT
jgi:hypothetical protein